MHRVKTYAGFIAGLFLAVAAVLAIVSLHNRQVYPAQRAAHENLEADLRVACLLPAEEFDAVSARAIRSNHAVWQRHERQRDSWLGDVLTPDGWGDVRYVVIPNEQECARIVRDSKASQCLRFATGDRQQEFVALGCAELLGAAYIYR